MKADTSPCPNAVQEIRAPAIARAERHHCPVHRCENQSPPADLRMPVQNAHGYWSGCQGQAVDLQASASNQLFDAVRIFPALQEKREWGCRPGRGKPSRYPTTLPRRDDQLEPVRVVEMRIHHKNSQRSGERWGT